VMSTQGDGEHPAAGSRRRSLGKKYRTTRLLPAHGTRVTHRRDARLEAGRVQ
jgi:hypothetical protein